MPDTNNAVVDPSQVDELNCAMQIACELLPQIAEKSEHLGTNPSAVASAFVIAGYQMMRTIDKDEFTIGFLESAIAQIKSGRPNPFQKSSIATKQRTH